MAHSVKRLLSLFLCVCLCVGLLPALPAGATYGTDPNAEQAPSKTMVTTDWGEIPDNWQGLVVDYQYDNADNPTKITLRVGAYNTPSASAWALCLHYDTKAVSLLLSDGSTGSATSTTIADMQVVNPDVVLDEAKQEGWVPADETWTGAFGPFSEFNTQTSPVSSRYGNIELALMTKSDLSTEETNTFGCYDSEDTNINLGSGLSHFYNLYFAVKDKTLLGEDTFTARSSSSVPETMNGGKIVKGDATLVSKGFYKTGEWPKGAEPTGAADVIVKVPNTSGAAQPFEGADVTISGHSDRDKTKVNETAKTGSDGTAKFTKIPHGTYDITVGVVSSNGKTYALPAGVHQVTVGNSSAPATVTMEEVEKTFRVHVAVKDAAGDAVDLSDSAPTLSLGGAAFTADAGANGTGYIDLPGGQEGMSLLATVSGYQKLGDGQSKINLSTTDTAGALSLGAQVNPAAAVTVEAYAATENGSDKIYPVNDQIVIRLKKTVTNVTMPLPAPTTEDGEKLTEEQAKGLTVTLTPKTGSAQAELGEKLTLKVGEGVELVQDADGKVTGIRVTAPLPAGSYDMTVGGAGFNTTEPVPVTVLEGTTNTVVNVGGTPAIDENEATGVEGGASAAVGKQTDPSENNAIDLSAGVQTGATVDPSTGTLSGGTEAGSLLDAGVVDALKPGAVTDPIYHVEVREAADFDKNAPEYEAVVTLQNATAVGGTFGMYFDPTIFAVDSDFTKAVTLNERIETTLVSGYDTDVVDTANGYVFFQWNTKISKADAKTQALSDGDVVATIQLPVKRDNDVIGNLSALFDEYAVYTMDYAQTTEGAQITNDLLRRTIWRIADQDHARPQTQFIDLKDEYSTRGGFYQVAVKGESGSTVHSDIRMEFVLPEIVTKLRADFHVLDAASKKGIRGAKLVIYKAPADGAAFDWENAEPVKLPVVTDKGVTEVEYLETDDDGYAAARLDAGEYVYTVDHKNYWHYPDGSVGTDTEELDEFEIGKDVLVTSGAHAVGGKDTAITGGYISPELQAMSYHKVALSVVDADDTEITDTTFAKLSGAAKAYNKVQYKFSIKPEPGWTWNTASYADMNKVAEALKATLYDVDSTKTTAAEMYRAGAYKYEDTTLQNPFDITWDGSYFVIAPANIQGDQVGDVEPAPDAGAAEKWFDMLRAGDIQVVALDDMFVQDTMTLTVTAGKGGTVGAAEPEPARPTDGGEASAYTKDGAAVTDLPISGAGAITEELSNGRIDSAVYTFLPEKDHIIEKVIINGEELTLSDAQKKGPFSYQFTQVGADETISVTFSKVEPNPDKPDEPIITPVSDPIVTVTAGANGKAVSNFTKPDAASAADSDPVTDSTAAYTAKAESTFKVTITPTTDGWEIDQVIVDDVAENVTDGKSHVVTFAGKDAMGAGKTHTVMATFKEIGKESTQAIVISKLDEESYGYGAISPYGKQVLNIGDTPEFAITPVDNWTMNTSDTKKPAILDNGSNRSSELSEDAATHVWSYTAAELKAGTNSIVAHLVERTITVKGAVKLAAGTRTVSAPALSFVRKPVDGGAYAREVFGIVNDKKTDSNACVAFEVELPVGEWTLTVTKQGYLDYTITGFTITSEMTGVIYFGDADYIADNESKMKPITLIAGDATGDGEVIAADDISQVAAGWIDQATEINKTKGDIDESEVVNSDDMSQVTTNFFELSITQPYTSAEKPADSFCGTAPATGA